MPPKGKALTENEIGSIRQWIDGGAVWPPNFDPSRQARNFWSLCSLRSPPVPILSTRLARLARNPVDAFVFARLHKEGIEPSGEAGRRALIRRLSYDLTGLPPGVERVERFVEDRDPLAYERLVEEFLASPRYGERWARHWLDLVHYGETHGYDKDKPRPNAWPYRDYVIDAFNQDLPYYRFIGAQLAGDALWPGTLEGLAATGFISAGPWDFIGHVEVAEEKIDGKVARNLDRDDMVANALNTFASLTVQCARCHNHKFDPVSIEEYYGLQAVFAALDRSEARFDPDPEIRRARSRLEGRIGALEGIRDEIEAEIVGKGGEEYRKAREALHQSGQGMGLHPAFGYHSGIEAVRNAEKWVEIDLGRPVALDRVEIYPAHDDYNGIGAGFGFPVRYRLEAGEGGKRRTVLDASGADQPNPGVEPVVVPMEGRQVRILRLTATSLALRSGDYILALAEIKAWSLQGKNEAREAEVRALDSIESGVRWSRNNLVDGIHPGSQPSGDIRRRFEAIRNERIPPELIAREDETERALSAAHKELASLPPPMRIYAGRVHTGSGNFRGTGAGGGSPREIRVLERGDVTRPGALAVPGALDLYEGAMEHFELPEGHPESLRRIALADWLADPRNPLTWRSLANRVWQHHFGTGLVATPNDFGRMGERPSHPQLLDWLACEFRDSGQSIKRLHRLILCSATYRQSSMERKRPAEVDSGNRLLWRMNRRRLDAESVRDTVLLLAGRLDTRMHGPSYRDFVLEKPEHSPHYRYDLHDPMDPLSHRRSVYRFLVRSQRQPFMSALDCADPSMQVARRDETLTPLQALAMLNNPFMVAMAGEMAASGSSEGELFLQALGRPWEEEEQEWLGAYARDHGRAAMCRLLLNLNEFLYLD